jgi:hypothetical protein
MQLGMNAEMVRKLRNQVSWSLSCSAILTGFAELLRIMLSAPKGSKASSASIVFVAQKCQVWTVKPLLSPFAVQRSLEADF